MSEEEDGLRPASSPSAFGLGRLAAARFGFGGGPVGNAAVGVRAPGTGTAGVDQFDLRIAV